MLQNRIIFFFVLEFRQCDDFFSDWKTFDLTPEKGISFR